MRIENTSRYPWATWMDGNQHRIVQGTDFSISPASMQTALHQYAGKHGFKVKTRVFDRTVMFKFSRVLASYGSGNPDAPATAPEFTAGVGFNLVWEKLQDEISQTIQHVLSSGEDLSYRMLFKTIQDLLGELDEGLFQVVLFKLVADNKMKLVK
jgi:hypothetical protein